jgi:hypothetical protein
MATAGTRCNVAAADDVDANQRARVVASPTSRSTSAAAAARN